MIAKHIAREQITVSTTIIGLDAGGTIITDAIKPRLRYVDLQVQAQQIRVTFDGTDPVALTTGQLWNPGDVKRVYGVAIMEALEMLRDSADAVVVADYWGE